MQRRLFWVFAATLVVLLVGLAVVWEELAEVPRSTVDADSVARLDERLRQVELRLEQMSGAAASSGVRSQPRSRAPGDDATGDGAARLRDRLDRLEMRVKALERRPAPSLTGSEDRRILRKLNAALAKGDMASVEALLAQHLELNAPDLDRQTPLCAAAIAGRPEFFDLLISHGAVLLC